MSDKQETIEETIADSNIHKKLRLNDPDKREQSINLIEIRRIECKWPDDDIKAQMKMYAHNYKHKQSTFDKQTFIFVLKS